MSGRSLEPGQLSIDLGDVYVWTYNECNINIQMNDSFQLEEVCVCPEIAEHFRVNDVQIYRKNSQSRVSCLLPDQKLNKEIPSMSLTGLVKKGEWVVVTVQKLTPNNCQFQGCLVGRLVSN